MIFTPDRIGQKACGWKCALAVVEQEKKQQYRKTTQKMKRELLDNDRSHWTKKAREACHAYIRARDKNDPCISCGRHHSGQYHAGHYRPAGVNSALRFDAINIHKQCAPCNQHMSGNLVAYRSRLIVKIGADAVDSLDNNHETKRWTVDELKEIAAHYKEKLKELHG